MRAFIFTVVMCTACAAVLATEPGVEFLEQQAMALANAFVALLKPQLKQALAQGGPASAIGVCDIAP